MWFNANDYKPSDGGSNLPIGDMLIVAKSSERKNNANNNGEFINFLCEVLDGPNKGATGNIIVNISHVSEDATRIGREQLSAICHVTQRMQLASLNAAEVLNIPFRVEVYEKKGKAKADGSAPDVNIAYKNWRTQDGRTISQLKQGTPGGQQMPQQNMAPAPQQPMQPAPQQPQGQGWGAPQPGQPMPGGWGGPQQPQPQPQQPNPAQGGWGGPQQATQPQPGQSWAPQPQPQQPGPQGQQAAPWGPPPAGNSGWGGPQG